MSQAYKVLNFVKKIFFFFLNIAALLLQLETICGNGGSKFEACYHLLLLEIYLFRVKTYFLFFFWQ